MLCTFPVYSVHACHPVYIGYIRTGQELLPEAADLHAISSYLSHVAVSAMCMRILLVLAVLVAAASAHAAHMHATKDFWGTPGRKSHQVLLRLVVVSTCAQDTCLRYLGSTFPFMF